MREKFLAANEESPVVSGSIIMDDDGKPDGVSYTLENRKRFKLTGDDAVGLPMPKWVHHQ
jgi:hypothetical protein